MIRVNIKTLFIIFATIAIPTFVLFVGAVFDLKQESQVLRGIESNRVLMLERATELRHSSDILTRYARIYTVTADSKYKETYFKILAIRNGTGPRPKNYSLIYWDLSEKHRKQKHPLGDASSLRVEMESLPYLPYEFEKLKQSEDNSNKLVQLEIKAFNAVAGVFQDESGEYTVKGESDQALAVSLLMSDYHHRAKKKIMQPLDEFLHSLSERTDRAVFEQNMIVNQSFQLIFVLLSLGFVLILSAIILIKRRVLIPIDYLTTVITSLLSGDKLVQEKTYSNDEIGFMINQFFIMKNHLDKNIEKLELSSRVINESYEGITITDANKIIIDVNPAFCKITGYSRDDVIGQTPQMLSSGKQGADFYADMWQKINKDGYWQGEIWNRRKDGEIYAELLSISALKDSDGNDLYYVGLFLDITSSKKQQEVLNTMAHYDILTKLPNRALFADRFKLAIAHSKRTKSLLAICFLDLDHFKPVNDNYGHDIGDLLLIEVSTCIKAHIREEDTVSRQGGDEFAILLGGLDSYEQCEKTLDRIHSALAEPFIIDGYPHQISASSGVTMYSSEDGDIDSLLRQADQAMYQAKQSGRNRSCLFNKQRAQDSSDKMNSIEQIQFALEDEQFQLYFQPKVNMKTGCVIGAEALIRWNHPEEGLIPPLDFLPLIDSNTLEIEVGEWVISSVFQQLTRWQEQGIILQISINISSYHLQSNMFVENLTHVLARYPSIDSKNIQLEILESSALGDIIQVREIINICRNVLGLSMALDDFGTGYSSLTHLRNLPVDTIKIDQSFVKNMLDDPGDYAIVEGIIGLASSFHRKVIAEGVETNEQGLMLSLMGCEEAQGYTIARPMTEYDFTNWVLNYQPNQQWITCANGEASEKEVNIELFKLIISRWQNHFELNIQSLLKGEDIDGWPIMDGGKSPCGMWIERVEKKHLFDKRTLNKLKEQHNEVHIVAGEIQSQCLSSDVEQVRPQLVELKGVINKMFTMTVKM